MKSLLLSALLFTGLWSIASADFFKMDGLDYTARTQPSGCPDQAQVTQEIATIYSVANSVRIYSLVDCNQGALILQAIKDLNINLRVALGIWLDQYYITEFPTEFAQLMVLANTYGLSQVDYVIVGSETQYRGNFAASILISYIQNISTTVKTQLGYPNIQVTTADVVQSLIAEPQVIAACDVVAYNQFSFWEGVPIQGAVSNNQNWYNQLVQNAQGKPILISEVGWLYQGQQATATAANVNTYIQNFVCWAQPAGIKYFYFSAYDALWQTEDDQKYWGIFGSDNQLKAGISLNFPCAAPAGTSTSAPFTSAPTTQAATTTAPTTPATTQPQTTPAATTTAPTTQATTQAQSTAAPTVPTTVAATTQAPTAPATTQAQSTAAPTSAATTQAPTIASTSAPTTQAATVAPTSAQTTVAPTNAATTLAPTNAATTVAPTVTSTPTNRATSTPTRIATSTPARTTLPTQVSTTTMPTSQPTNRPTTPATSQPTRMASTSAPVTAQPTNAPTQQPTQVITSQPTSAPTSAPTERPTSASTQAPTSRPTSQPTSTPSSAPTSTPSSSVTTSAPTSRPTLSATTQTPTTIVITSSPTVIVTSTPQHSDASRVVVSLGLALMIAVAAF